MPSLVVIVDIEFSHFVELGISNFLVFAPVQILTKGGPQGTTNLVMSEIFTRTFIYGDNKGGAAATVILVTAVMAVVLIQFRMMRARG